jgi:hypothetical protein
MRQPVVLKGPGASTEDIAAEFGISKRRQAAINEIVRSVLQKGKGPEHESVSKRSASKKKASARK